MLYRKNSIMNNSFNSNSNKNYKENDENKYKIKYYFLVQNYINTNNKYIFIKCLLVREKKILFDSIFNNILKNIYIKNIEVVVLCYYYIQDSFTTSNKELKE